MKKYSLSKAILASQWNADGLITNADGSISKGFEMEPLSSGTLEDSFEGSMANNFFSKLSELLTKLPNLFEGQILLRRQGLHTSEIPGLTTKIYFFEKVQKVQSYSHLSALFTELKLSPKPISKSSWNDLLSGFVGEDIRNSSLPDIIWEKDCFKVKNKVVRVLSLTELPQITWKGCFQTIFESVCDFTLSIQIAIPDRTKIKRQLETKRRVSHALSITNSLEVRNIESNSVLHSSEETLERILINKETLFEVSVAVILLGDEKATLTTAHDLERVVSGIGNAGLYPEGLGTLPVAKSHIPGNKMLGIRKMPILSENLSHMVPLLHNYSRTNDRSSLELRSQSGEVSHLNLFSKENLNYNSFICGASGSGKSFLMNAILTSNLKDVKNTRICIFDVLQTTS